MHHAPVGKDGLGSDIAAVEWVIGAPSLSVVPGGLYVRRAILLERTLWRDWAGVLVFEQGAQAHSLKRGFR